MVGRTSVPRDSLVLCLRWTERPFICLSSSLLVQMVSLNAGPSSGPARRAARYHFDGGRPAALFENRFETETIPL